MDAQTLQQQTPIYHVCQNCGGEGCAACSDLLILDGDIQLDLEWSDELPAIAPINGVIGTTVDDVFSTESRFAHVAKLMASMPYRATNAGINRDVLCDAADLVPIADPVCPKCGKSRFDSPYGCLAPQVYSPAAGDWVCSK